MYIETLKIENWKLIKSREPDKIFKLDFKKADGTPRMWTVLIGKNGTGKTSILQAIALAAVGKQHVVNLALPITRQVPDCRSGQPPEVCVEATFQFSDKARNSPSAFPKLAPPYPANLRLTSRVWLPVAKAPTFQAKSYYESTETLSEEAKNCDPLEIARSEEKNLWFVAGYGVSRLLPDAAKKPTLEYRDIDRLRPLFYQDAGLTSTGFARYFGELAAAEDAPAAKANAERKVRMFVNVLMKALFSVDDLMSREAVRLVNFDSRGRFGQNQSESLQETPRFVQRIGGKDYKIPAVALPHGYQSTIAWIADLVGHVVLEADMDLEPKDMRGLVLIDELDLYLHPAWQVVLVRALKKTFPGMQFVVTTHSPLVLAALNPDEDQVVRLEHDETTGDVVRVEVHEDPRLLTGTELLRLYFDLDDIHPDPVGRALREYRYLAANPYRTADDERRMAEFKAELDTGGVDPHFEPVPKKTFVRRTG
jgi:hypothetical protein